MLNLKKIFAEFYWNVDKKLIMRICPCLFALQFFFLTPAFAQTDACHGDWTEWKTMYTFKEGVYLKISFKLPKSRNDACQTVYYRFDNDYYSKDAYLKFKIDFQAPDGKISTNTFSHFELNRTGILFDSGNFSYGNGVANIYNIDFVDPNKKQGKDLDESVQNIYSKTTKQQISDPQKKTIPLRSNEGDMGKRADNSKATVETLAITNQEQTQRKLQQNTGGIQTKYTTTALGTRSPDQDEPGTSTSALTTGLVNLLTREPHNSADDKPAVNPSDKGYEYWYSGDYKNALKWYNKAVEAGNADAMLSIGQMYQNGEGVKRDDRQALTWFTMAANKGNIPALRKIAFLYYNGGNNVPINYPLALEWFKKSADQGNNSARYALGLFYEHGIGTPINYPEAMEWYKKAAQKGSTEAMNSIALLYENGKGVPVNYQLAIDWYKRAIEDDETTAMYNLGAMYARGLGVPIDQAAAYQLFNRAAALGNDGAMYTLGDWFLSGIYVTKDLTQAKSWYLKAAKKNNKAAIDKLKELN